MTAIDILWTAVVYGAAFGAFIVGAGTIIAFGFMIVTTVGDILFDHD